MIKLKLTLVDEGEWELDLGDEVTLTMDEWSMKELRDLLNRAIDTFPEIPDDEQR